MSRRTFAGWASLVAVGIAVAACTSLGPAVGADETPRPGRVLIIALPHVTWDDIARVRPRNLDRLFAGSAVGDLTSRASDRLTGLGDGYLSLGAGGRAFGDGSTDGESFQVGERFGSGTAGDAFARRTGARPRHGIVALDVVALRRINQSLQFDAQLGALGDTLAQGGYRRAVIANGDGELPDAEGASRTTIFQRSAALALMGTSGTLRLGRVDDALLERAPGGPYGVRLDDDAVLRAFDRVWKDRSVVLVEGSDLVRAVRYQQLATTSEGDRLFDRALRHSDRMIGKLLARVDPARDAVIVVSPTQRNDVAALTVVSLKTAGIDRGLLRSGTTRRTGFVQLMDIAPTVLDIVGLEAPGKMEGRSIEARDQGGSFADRRDALADADAAARFRDARLAEVQGMLVGLAIVTALLAAAALCFRARRGWHTAARLAALTSLAFAASTFLARLAPLHDAGVAPYWAFLVVVTAGLVTAFLVIGRGNVLDPLLVALLLLAGLLLVDTVLGTPLQFASPLGPSATASGRFGGLGNPSYALLTSAALLAATLLPQRMRSRAGTRLGLTLLLVVVIVDGAPFWGADVGGILSLVPAFGIAAALMLGVRLRWRHVAVAVGALIGALASFTFIDLSQARDNRSHLARLVERIQADGLGDFVVVVERKLLSNFSAFSSSLLGIIVAIVLGFLVWVWFARHDDVRALTQRIPAWRATCISFALLAGLGWAFNDSGIAIPGIMLLVLNAAFVWLVLWNFDEQGAARDPTRSSHPLATVS